METTRLHVYFSGMVQGVGFRYTTHFTAQRYDVTGFVRNLRDGRVELVVEGQREEAQAILDEISDHMAGYIDSKDVNWSTPTGEFSRFSVAH